MRKRTSPTMMERATEAVQAFKDVLRKLDEQVALRGQSQSTLHNYSRRIAQFVLHFHALPQDVDEDRINTYLATLARDPKAPSRNMGLQFTAEEEISQPKQKTTKQF